MLHKTNRMRGFHIHATDGGIGHVDDFLVDEGTWHVRYFVVDTSNWIGGRWVLISPTVVSRVDSPGSKEVGVLSERRRHSTEQECDSRQHRDSRREPQETGEQVGRPVPQRGIASGLSPRSSP